MLLYMLVCGEPPFQEANDSETLTMIMDCKYRIPAHVPPDCARYLLRVYPFYLDFSQHNQPTTRKEDSSLCTIFYIYRSMIIDRF